jgi:hypothetical protein
MGAFTLRANFCRYHWRRATGRDRYDQNPLCFSFSFHFPVIARNRLPERHSASSENPMELRERRFRKMYVGAGTFMALPEVTTSVGIEMNPMEEQELGNRIGRGKIFPHLVDRAAFIDTIKLSVYSDQKPRPDGIADYKNGGILSRRSNYSRKITGTWTLTGNPVVILYGKVNRFSAVPPASMTVRSESMPVTAGQVNKMVESVFPSAGDVRVSLVELTFDVSGLSYSEARRSIVYRAIDTQEFGEERNGRTLDIGSPRSPWFASIYEKARNVLRIEVKLRRGFLSAEGLNSPNDLVALRTLQLSRMICLRKFSPSRITAATENWPETSRDWYQRCETRPLWLLHRIFGANGLDANHLLPQSHSQRQLQAMQGLLVW